MNFSSNHTMVEFLLVVGFLFCFVIGFYFPQNHSLLKKYHAFINV